VLLLVLSYITTINVITTTFCLRDAAHETHIGEVHHRTEPG